MIRIRNLTQKVFHFICIKEYQRKENNPNRFFQKGLDDAREFFNVRFKGKIDFKGKRILDVGCGYGTTCIHMSENGAEKVVGIDIDENRIIFAKSKLINDYKDLANIVEFRYIENMDNNLNHETFDIIISKDSFEHYTDPENIINNMKQKLKKKGIIVIGFGPLWRSPYGGHIQFMTKFPWAHLLFPESVIMAERKKFRPSENAESFEQVVGGLNKMTLKRYLNIVKENGLGFEYFKVNLSPTKLMFIFNILRRIPFCKELFTQNVYSIIYPISDLPNKKNLPIKHGA